MPLLPPNLIYLGGGPSKLTCHWDSPQFCNKSHIFLLSPLHCRAGLHCCLVSVHESIGLPSCVLCNLPCFFFSVPPLSIAMLASSSAIIFRYALSASRSHAQFRWSAEISSTPGVFCGCPECFHSPAEIWLFLYVLFLCLLKTHWTANLLSLLRTYGMAWDSHMCGHVLWPSACTLQCAFVRMCCCAGESCPLQPVVTCKFWLQNMRKV